MTIYITKDNLVCNMFTEKTGVIPLTVSDKLYWQKLCVTPFYYAWQYDDENDEFNLVPILTAVAMRERRKVECFDLIDNKSRLWWDNLSSEDYAAVNAWYQAWLDAPETLVVPDLPEVLK